MSNKKCPNCGYELDSWNDCVSVNNILECPECEEHFELKAVTLNKPQLTIPKSIADMLDFIYDNHFDFNDDVSWVIANIDFLPTDEDYYNFDGWINLSVDNHNLALAYLAGKALGVDLVKVVEG
ncbi:hypothetical protein [Lactococcus lactis]|uniref:Uncharacterized protein n=1 Tax=Lactococcus lactis TaxID=1358 RepID=A0AAW5TS99_9LACT|nr:hypothetical protein [Lactococcus lactis]MCW2281401.1 hypothetical protein [Lactococcus lactis]